MSHVIPLNTFNTIHTDTPYSTRCTHIYDIFSIRCKMLLVDGCDDDNVDVMLLFGSVVVDGNFSCRCTLMIFI